MSEMSRLERGYRRLVACYPRSFRKENQEEIIAVLLATSRDGQQRPGLAESADLLAGAFRMHMGLSRAPRSVLTAVRLMCLGAVAELGVLVTALVTWGSIRAHAVAHYPHYAAQVSRLVNDDVTADMVILPILILAWLWVAWGNGRGSQLARVAAIVFAALYTLVLAINLSEGVALLAPAALIVSGVSWALGVGAVAFVLAPRSWPYYERPPAARSQDALV
jgi:hypothetical protein